MKRSISHTYIYITYIVLVATALVITAGCGSFDISFGGDSSEESQTGDVAVAATPVPTQPKDAAAKATPTATETPTAETTQEEAKEPTAQPTKVASDEGVDAAAPDAEVQPAAVNGEAGPACFGSSSGASCLEADGTWTLYTTDNSALTTNELVDVALCADGTRIFAAEEGIDLLRGNEWTHFDQATWGRGNDVRRVICADDSSIWVAHSDGIAKLVGADWTFFESDVLHISPPDFGPKEIEFAPDGTLWAAAQNSIAQLQGETWIVYEAEAGLPTNNYTFSEIAFDPSGQPIALDKFGGVARFDGSTWTFAELELLQDIAGFSVDDDGRLWLGSAEDGVQRFAGAGQVFFDRTNSDISSNNIFAMERDAAHRIWIGTEWGLNIWQNDTWTAYHMESADLPHNQITSIAVLDAGPTLPTKLEKAAGSITGRMMRQGEPVENMNVEICVESLGFIYRGDSPCASQQRVFNATTGADGHFMIADVPPGYYIFTFEDDRWTILSEGILGFTNSRVLVAEGTSTDIGEFELDDDYAPQSNATDSNAANSSTSDSNTSDSSTSNNAEGADASSAALLRGTPTPNRFPTPNLPTPNLPTPNLPTPNLPTPNLPEPNLPTPNIPEIEFPEIGFPDIEFPEVNLPEPAFPEIEPITPWGVCQTEDAETQPLQTVNVEVILDASGSMAGGVGNVRKIDAAKIVLHDFVERLPSETNVALRVYGHLGTNQEADRTLSCSTSELLSDFQTSALDDFATAISPLEPTGWTPLALALEQAGAHFAETAASKSTSDGATSDANFIFLVSDGIETCGGDPVAAARALHESDINVIVNIVGFDVDAEAADQLRTAAAAGGGQYYSATNPAELQTIFREGFVCP